MQKKSTAEDKLGSAEKHLQAFFKLKKYTPF